MKKPSTPGLTVGRFCSNRGMPEPYIPLSAVDLAIQSFQRSHEENERHIEDLHRRHEKLRHIPLDYDQALQRVRRLRWDYLQQRS
jgi:hypothetical protein